jgi:hypothetical protein
MSDLGKLKRTTSEKHSCGCPLQLRTRGTKTIGEIRVYEEEYLYCPRCDEEIEVKHKIKRFKVDEPDLDKDIKPKKGPRNLNRSCR